jgi:hypothetical protein
MGEVLNSDQVAVHGVRQTRLGYKIDLLLLEKTYLANISEEQTANEAQNTNCLNPLTKSVHKLAICSLWFVLLK